MTKRQHDAWPRWRPDRPRDGRYDRRAQRPARLRSLSKLGIAIAGQSFARKPSATERPPIRSLPLSESASPASNSATASMSVRKYTNGMTGVLRMRYAMAARTPRVVTATTTSASQTTFNNARHHSVASTVGAASTVRSIRVVRGPYSTGKSRFGWPLSCAISHVRWTSEPLRAGAKGATREAIVSEDAGALGHCRGGQDPTWPAE
jgi:hypothetical protein